MPHLGHSLQYQSFNIGDSVTPVDTSKIIISANPFMNSGSDVSGIEQEIFQITNNLSLSLWIAWVNGIATPTSGGSVPFQTIGNDAESLGYGGIGVINPGQTVVPLLRRVSSGIADGLHTGSYQVTELCGFVFDRSVLNRNASSYSAFSVANYAAQPWKFTPNVSVAFNFSTSS